MVGARVLSNVASSAESFTSDTLGIAAAYLSYLSSGTINQEVYTCVWCMHVLSRTLLLD